MMDNRLCRQQAFDDLIATVLARFTSGVGAELEGHIQSSLEEIGRFIGVDHAFVIQVATDMATWTMTHEWCDPDAPSRLKNYQNVPMGTFDWTERAILAREVVRLNSLDDIPPEATEVRKRMESLGFKSTLQLPLQGRGGLVNGCVALSSLRHEVTWTDVDAKRLRLVGDAIANALERKHLEGQLRDGEARYRATFEKAPVGIANVSIDGRVFRANQRLCDMLGYTYDELLSRHFSEFTHADDRQASAKLYDELLTRGTSTQSLEKRYCRKDGSVVWGKLTLSLLSGEGGEPSTVIAAVEEISDRKRAEEGLRDALQEVERLTSRLQAENIYLQEEIANSQGFDEIVGQSEILRSTLSKVEHVAGTHASVLLLGETGTGKELLARAIHGRSPRNGRPLVKVNLAALPSSLIESELFGHVKGAFTGAISDKVGRFELADGGTLFLDEIGELELELQTKLLRVLQEGEYERIGSSETRRADVRVVAATNRDLRQAMEDGKFRPDLYYRLAVFPIEVPPLRFRREDIPLLVWHFVSKKQVRLGRTINSIPKPVMDTLVEYDWPGNIRELENVIERAMILAPGSVLVFDEPLKSARHAQPKARPASPVRADRAEIVRALEECDWKIKGAGNAAERLGLKPSTLRYRMRIMGIPRPQSADDG